MTQPADYTSTFALLDADGDGLISTEELHRLMSSLGEPVNDDQVRHAIGVMDLDGDGLVSLPELTAFLESGATG